MTRSNAPQDAVEVALVAVRAAVPSCVATLERFESLRPWARVWSDFVAASVRNVEALRASSATAPSDPLPAFGSWSLAQRMREPLLPVEAAREMLDVLRPVEALLDDAFAAHPGEVPLLMALGYVMAGLVELELCIVSAHPALDIWPPESS